MSVLVRGAIAVVAVVAVAFAVFSVVGDPPAEGSPSPSETIREVDVDPAAVAAAGPVSDGQMRATLLEVAACASGAGFETELVEFVPGLRWQFQTDLGVEEDNDRAARASEALDACAAQVAVTIDAYQAQNRLSPAEEAAFENRIRACMNERGVAVAEGESPALAGGPSGGTAFNECQAEAFQKPGG